MENLNSMQPIMSYDPADFFFNFMKESSHLAILMQTSQNHLKVIDWLGFLERVLYTVMNLYSEHDG